MKKNKNSLPVKKQIMAEYDKFLPFFTQILMNIKNKLDDTVFLNSRPNIKTRIKSFDSYYKKAIRLKPELVSVPNNFVCVSDIIGIRVICAFIEDLAAVLTQIEENFVVLEVENKAATQSFKEFGYDSIHVLIEIPEDCFPNKSDFDFKIPENLVCEIQIRTILQDAWAEVEHELIYKGEFSPFDTPLRRKLASINASLSLADIIFQEIRDYQKQLQSEVDERRFSFYQQVDEKTGHIGEVAKKNIPITDVSPFVRGTIDDLILSAMHAHNAGDFEKAVSIYTQILEATPAPSNVVLSVISKHRGMAYFSKSEYEKALEDFEMSSRLDPKNFRALYYEGIVYAILKQYEKAIECYTASIELNEFHSHTFFRRAMAYYELDEYENALNDVIAAKNLGMDDNESRHLHQRLIKKLDMEV